MKRVLMIAIAVSVLLFSGCDVQYNGSIKVNKIDGKVNTVEVNMPGQYTLKNRDEADRLIKHMESLLADVKQAREQMPIAEPIQPQPQPEQK